MSASAYATASASAYARFSCPQSHGWRGFQNIDGIFSVGCEHTETATHTRSLTGLPGVCAPGSHSSTTGRTT